ncbi:MAG: hypothetical protein EOM90_16715 [Alphaproteobacteria bacterium]|nr:hypothetical protein [Alphaproteobacteria bacterium]
MTRLIEPLTVIEIAYITEIDPYMIKDSFILNAEIQYIKPALGVLLYEDVLLHFATGKYTSLINDYIKPCLAYFIKAAMLNQMLIETSQYTTGSDPTLAQSLVDVSTAVLIPTNHRRDMVNDVYRTAFYKLELLTAYLAVNTSTYPLYTAPVATMVAGFRISS